MAADKILKLGLGSLALGGLLVLGACGQETAAPEEDQYAGFDIDNAGTEPTPEDVEPEEEVEIADAPIDSVDDLGADPTDPPIINHDADDEGEDLFRRGYQQDAMALWEANAEAGDSYAAYRLGIEYFDANYVERNVELSLRYQTLAAELGHAGAMFELGSFLEAGLGVRQDMAQAAGWYLASAVRGYAPAQHNVATMFEDGVGHPQDLSQAYLFYSLARAQGFTMDFEPVHDQEDGTYVDSIARLQGLMTTEQLFEAQSLIDNFVPLD